jgi:DNA-binding LytR/AlgR family response regulator
MSKIKVLIVEDEVLIAETISLYLEEFGILTAAICISYEEAIEAYHLHSPDLILIDIRLFGQKSGIDLAQYFNAQQNKPPYIFLTSQYDKRILDAAIQTLPYGYITKPFMKETLWTSITSAYELYKSSRVEGEKIEVYDGKFTHFIMVKEIVYLESENVYTNFVLNTKKQILSRVSLDKCEETLSKDNFFRCHRSFIINLNCIENYGKEEVKLTNGIVIPISRSKKNEWVNLMDKKQLS